MSTENPLDAGGSYTREDLCRLGKEMNRERVRTWFINFLGQFGLHFIRTTTGYKRVPSNVSRNVSNSNTGFFF